jgi:DNA anti-recombination protein RmuC
MNAPFLTPIQGGKSLGTSDAIDAQMEQIRDLLIGDHQRATSVQLAGLATQIRDLEARLSARMDAAEATMTAKLQTLEASVQSQMVDGEQAMQQRIDGLAQDVAGHRRAALEALSHGVDDLTNHIRRIAGS